MKIVLYMASTINGFIAKNNDDAPWSDETWDSYLDKASEFESMIIGRRTYEIMKSVNEFEDIGNPFTIVITNKEIKDNLSNIVSAKSIDEAIDKLKEKDFQKVLLAGGGMINSLFLQKNLIDEIYLDVEPMIFGSGIKLFKECDFDLKLELVGIKNISKNTIQLHYRSLRGKIG